MCGLCSGYTMDFDRSWQQEPARVTTKLMTIKQAKTERS